MSARTPIYPIFREGPMSAGKISHQRPRGRTVAVVGFVLCLAMAPAFGATTSKPSAQAEFASPEAAVDALVAAARGNRVHALIRLLGPGGRKLVVSGDPVADRQGRARFVAEFDRQYVIETEGDARARVVIGDDHWPLPIPIVRLGKFWRFDAKEAEQEILARRIGRNELNAIEVCHAYVTAQQEYASQDREGGGILEYAQKFTSSPGKRDGLYWQTKPGEPESPVGPLVAHAHAEGYKVQPYHGYYYRILKAQGSHAPGGGYSYLAKGHMIGGFALIAFPAKWGDSGIMTFIVGRDGIVYEKNLGPRTSEIARTVTVFEPDGSWRKP